MIRQQSAPPRPSLMERCYRTRSLYGLRPDQLGLRFWVRDCSLVCGADAQALQYPGGHPVASTRLSVSDAEVAVGIPELQIALFTDE